MARPSGLEFGGFSEAWDGGKGEKGEIMGEKGEGKREGRRGGRGR